MSLILVSISIPLILTVGEPVKCNCRASFGVSIRIKLIFASILSSAITSLICFAAGKTPGQPSIKKMPILATLLGVCVIVTSISPLLSLNPFPNALNKSSLMVKYKQLPPSSGLTLSEPDSPIDMTLPSPVLPSSMPISSPGKA